MHLVQGPPLVSFEDLALKPQYSEIRSRKEIDLFQSFRNGASLMLPIIGSPMDTVSDSKSVLEMLKNGCSGIIHRYNHIDFRVSEVRKILNSLPWDKHTYLVCAAIGITGDFVLEAKKLEQAGANCICVDVAHGHHIMMKECIQELKRVLRPETLIMAGNVATLEGFMFLENLGVDLIRVNISGGSACATKKRTSAGIPTAATLLEITQYYQWTGKERKAKMIADGGIKNSGHIVLALACGADIVMVGSLFSCHEESPGPVKKRWFGPNLKCYRGMSSPSAQVDWRGFYSSNEGEEFWFPIKGKLENTIKELDNGVRSGISYCGSKNLKEFQQDAILVQLTPASQQHLLLHADKK